MRGGSLLRGWREGCVFAVSVMGKSCVLSADELRVGDELGMRVGFVASRALCVTASGS
jgi:hypothetical protein